MEISPESFGRGKMPSLLLKLTRAVKSLSPDCAKSIFSQIWVAVRVSFALISELIKRFNTTKNTRKSESLNIRRSPCTRMISTYSGRVRDSLWERNRAICYDCFQENPTEIKREIFRKAEHIKENRSGFDVGVVTF